MIERQKDGSYAVRETRGSETRLWTRAELEAAISLVEGMAGTVEPLVKHMTNLEGSAAAFQSGRQPAYNYVRKIVRRMEAANKEAVGDAFGRSWIYTEGLEHLFGSELGREALLPFLKQTVTVGTFVLFAPADYVFDLSV